MSNDYTNPNTNPRILTTLTLTLTDPDETLLCADNLWLYSELLCPQTRTYRHFVDIMSFHRNQDDVISLFSISIRMFSERLNNVCHYNQQNYKLQIRTYGRKSRALFIFSYELSLETVRTINFQLQWAYVLELFIIPASHSL